MKQPIDRVKQTFACAKQSQNRHTSLFADSLHLSIRQRMRGEILSKRQCLKTKTAQSYTPKRVKVFSGKIRNEAASHTGMFASIDKAIPYSFFSAHQSFENHHQEASVHKKRERFRPGGTNETKTPSTCIRVQTATRKPKTTDEGTTETSTSTKTSKASRQSSLTTQSETRSIPGACGCKPHHAEPWRTCLSGNLSRLAERLFQIGTGNRDRKQSSRECAVGVGGQERHCSPSPYRNDGQ